MQGVGERIYYENAEGHAAFNVPRKFWIDRPHGLSAMVRVKNEAEWILFSLDSIAGWCDEVAIFLQGEQTDGTDRLVDAWAAEHSNARVMRYPFESLPNGPGHDRQRRGSVYERAYFYNWCHAHTHYSHAMKWDGDMVALDWLGGAKRTLLRQDCTSFRGVDLAGYDMRHQSVRPSTANEPRVWCVREDTFYYSGHKCEYFTRNRYDGVMILEPAYLHLKWVKANLDNSRKDWPQNWTSIPHFVRINNRRERGDVYTGPIPAALAAERDRRQAEGTRT